MTIFCVKLSSEHATQTQLIYHVLSTGSLYQWIFYERNATVFLLAMFTKNIKKNLYSFLAHFQSSMEQMNESKLQASSPYFDISSAAASLDLSGTERYT